MTPREAGAGRGADPLSIPSPLGLRHWDGQPVTLDDCQAEYRKACQENITRAAELRALERQEAPDVRAYKALIRAAQIGNARARVWGSLELLAQEAGTP